LDRIANALSLAATGPGDGYRTANYNRSLVRAGELHLIFPDPLITVKYENRFFLAFHNESKFYVGYGNDKPYLPFELINELMEIRMILQHVEEVPFQSHLSLGEVEHLIRLLIRHELQHV